jgi:hypothetical protein
VRLGADKFDEPAETVRLILDTTRRAGTATSGVPADVPVGELIEQALASSWSYWTCQSRGVSLLCTLGSKIKPEPLSGWLSSPTLIRGSANVPPCSWKCSTTQE